MAGMVFFVHIMIPVEQPESDRPLLLPEVLTRITLQLV
jgi:hypothetical protein